jgi:hypothetical protein
LWVQLPPRAPFFAASFAKVLILSGTLGQFVREIKRGSITAKIYAGQKRVNGTVSPQLNHQPHLTPPPARSASGHLDVVVVNWR